MWQKTKTDRDLQVVEGLMGPVLSRIVKKQNWLRQKCLMFTGCQWKKLGQARGGENVRVIYVTYFIFTVILNVPSWAHVSKDFFYFYALYTDE